jgi:ATP-dependent RNA helicase DDX19/DBP5
VTFAHDGRSFDETKEIMEATGRPMKRIDASRSTDIEHLEKVRSMQLDTGMRSTG